MVGHRHSESLPGIDVSPRVVVTLGVLVLLRGRAAEEQQGAAERAERVLLRAAEDVHRVAAVSALHRWTEGTCGESLGGFFFF